MASPILALLRLGARGGLFIALVLAGAAMGARAAPDPAGEPPVGQPGHARVDPARAGPDRADQRLRSSILSWERDPFTRGSSLGELSGLALSGILWDPHQPIAIINGEMVQVGDELGGYQVTAIAEDRVSLTDGTQTFQLRISP